MNIIAIGAHPDDIEIGCGGTLAAHTAKGDRVIMVVMSAGERGGSEASVRLTELGQASKILGVEEVVCLDYPDTEVPSDAAAIRKLDQVIEAFRPQRAYIPFWREIHQDHRHTSEVALSACRNVPQVLAYEGPSTYPDFVVQHFCDIALTIDRKLESIGAHASQGAKEILKIEAIRSLNRFRGYQSRSEYAEGFAVFRFIEKI